MAKERVVFLFADDFKPASVDTSQQSIVEIEENSSVSVTVPHVEVRQILHQKHINQQS